MKKKDVDKWDRLCYVFIKAAKESKRWDIEAKRVGRPTKMNKKTGLFKPNKYQLSLSVYSEYPLLMFSDMATRGVK